MDIELVEESELDALKKRADKLGITYHTNIGVDKLRDKVNSFLAEDVPEEVPLTRKQELNALKKEQEKLVRVRITCMDPSSKALQGEFLTVSNKLVGTLKRYVPFAVEWHVPQIMLNVLRQKQHSVFFIEKIGKKEITRYRLVNTYAIEILEPLTVKELRELARKQAMAAGTEE